MVGQPTATARSRVAALVEGTANYLAAALSPSSLAQYQRSWRSFCVFCNDIGKQSLPADFSSVALYITNLAGIPSSPATIASALSAVGYFHNLKSLPDPTQHFIVRKVLKGVSNLHKGSDLRIPISTSILSELIAAASKVTCSAYEGKLLAAMFALMFFGFLRLGEVTASPHNLCFDNVSLDGLTCSITFLSFKHCSGLPVTIGVSRLDSPICPVSLLADFLKIRGSGTGPLFCYPRGLPVSPGHFRSLLAAAVARCGRSDLKITPHSFRIGAATHAAAQGLSTTLIQSMGRWKSDAFRRYIRIPALRL